MQRKSKLSGLSGQRFHHLTVISRAPSPTSGNRGVVYHCLCDCGNRTVTQACKLINGRAKSCGCYSREMFKKSLHKHGRCDDKLYRTWTTIKHRCLNPSNKAYPNYGGRGVTICDEWKNDFSAFADYLGERPSPEYTVDRIDNNRGYEPGNVHWATRTEQSRNMRSNLMITYHDKTQCLQDWALETGIDRGTIYHRIYILKLSLEEALTRPPRTIRQ